MSEFMKSAKPFVSEFVDEIQAVVFNLKHPSYVEEGREEKYLANLHVIRKHFE
jgi:hypothetical protein